VRSSTHLVLIPSYNPGPKVFETVRAGYPFVANVRQDDTLNGTVATVDNIDSMPGRVALVLSLRDLLGTPPQGGNYGVKPGAATLLPKS